MRTLIVLPLVFFSLACADTSGSHFGPGTVSHVVIVYLKKPGDAAEPHKIIETSKTLRQIPGVLSVEAGKVLPSVRAPIVSDYDVGVVITFKDVEAMQAYIKHPIHEKAANEVLLPLTAKAFIYDFVNE